MHQLKVFPVGQAILSAGSPGCWLSCTHGIAEEFGHGESVIWTYLLSGPSNPALHLLINALGTLLLDKQTLDTPVTASNLITSVILEISRGHDSHIGWHYISALSTRLTFPRSVTWTVQPKQITRFNSHDLPDVKINPLDFCLNYASGCFFWNTSRDLLKTYRLDLLPFLFLSGRTPLRVQEKSTFLSNKCTNAHQRAELTHPLPSRPSLMHFPSR